MNRICRHAYVSGRVQGVWFRGFVRDKAEKSGVAGWAKNLSDGRVEVLLCGDSKAVHKVEAALHHGPPFAKVTEVIVNTRELTEIPKFSIS